MSGIGASAVGGSPAGGMPPANLPPPQFFVDHKKGEVNELRQLLRAVSLDKDVNKRRDVIKKVIAYMTLGIDVSRLYPEMVKASRTDDVVMKKMIYLYLINYAEQNQELAILAINTFLMDCKQANHKIRGLALRSLCSLRFEGVTQYLQQAILDGLNDVDPYVKKTAIIGCVKFYHMSKKEFKKTDFLDTLYKLTKDHDSLVVINAIEAINEIRANKGGIEVQRALVIHLLNRIKEFNEWGQSIILELTAKYNPANQEEMFDIMNLLEDRFKHASSSVVLGAVKVFLHLTKDNDDLSRQVFERLQAPLITLMTSSETTESYEVSFNVLSHIHLLVVKGANTVFEAEYKHFFVKYDEPSYIKNLKLEILAHIASPNNIQEIVNELSEYVTDVNAEIAKKSIRCFGTIIIRLTKMSKTVAAQLRNFLSLRISYVTTETVIVLKDILRKYRNFIDDFIPFFSKISLDQIQEIEGKCAYVWILGEFGELIEESPYILEKMIEEQKEFNSVKLSGVLLTALFKLFFKRAPEVQRMLGQFLETVVKTAVETDLKQKAVFYYRLLKADIAMAEKIVNGDHEKVAEFYEDKNEEIRERLFLEFNSLSVVYQKPSERFLKDNILKQAMSVEKKYYSVERWSKKGPVRGKRQVVDEDEEEEQRPKSSTVVKTEEIQQQQPVASLDDLLDFGSGSTQQQTSQPADLLGDFGIGGSSNQAMGSGNLLGNDLFGQPQQPVGQMNDDLLGTNNPVLGGVTSQDYGQQKKVQYALDDLSGMGGFGGGIGGNQVANSNQSVELAQVPDLDSERFQSLWMQLPDSQNVVKALRPDMNYQIADFEQALAQHKIYCMASGQIGNELKFFFYAQLADKSGYFLVETLVNQQTKVLSANLKTTRTDLGHAFLNNNLVKVGADAKQREKEERFLKERLEQEKERLLREEMEKYEKDKDLHRGKKAIKNCGIMDAYDLLLEDIIKNGMPELKLNGDLFEYAAFFLSKYHKKKQYPILNIISIRKKKEWEEREKRQRERERHRLKSSITGVGKLNQYSSEEEESDDDYRGKNKRGRSKSVKGAKGGKKGAKSVKSEDSRDAKGKSKGRSKSKKGGPKSRRSDSAQSKKKGKAGAKGGKGGTKSRASDSPKSAKGKSKGAPAKGAKKGGAKSDVESERGRSKSKAKGGAKEDPKRAKSTKKVQIEEDAKSGKGGKGGKDAKGGKGGKEETKGGKGGKEPPTPKGKDNGKNDKGRARSQSQGRDKNDKNNKDTGKDAKGGKAKTREPSRGKEDNKRSKSRGPEKSPEKKGKGGKEEKKEEPAKGGKGGKDDKGAANRDKSVDKSKINAKGGAVKEEPKGNAPQPKRKGV